ncbi:hypothetical protein CAPTEDRAFT_210429 [Capitella teleta]|uniref:Secreted protein n=1 Tax=Capitella teleta TaxID=283909 RepID=R7U084_CAPTE|nr:hypothetical protein CAPTEDRAFT_210429 [Capitella teleta]|eukprot:ELT96615.1 hypothetical protein CAPTEDRAFT_210429 [Capitella teleta]
MATCSWILSTIFLLYDIRSWLIRNLHHCRFLPSWANQTKRGLSDEFVDFVFDLCSVSGRKAVACQPAKVTDFRIALLALLQLDVTVTWSIFFSSNDSNKTQSNSLDV